MSIISKVFKSFAQLFESNTPRVADISAEQFFDFVQHVKNLSDSHSRNNVTSKGDAILKYFLENKSPKMLVNLPPYVRAIYDLQTTIRMMESSKRPMREQDWDFVAADFCDLARSELRRLNTARRVGIERLYPIPLIK